LEAIDEDEHAAGRGGGIQQRPSFIIEIVNFSE
jgi:hypothetical protein